MHTQEAVAKDQMFKLRLEEKDRARLDAISAHFEMTAAQTIRTLLKDKARELGVEPVPPPPPSSPRTKSAKKR